MLKPSPMLPFSSSICCISVSHIAKEDPWTSSVFWPILAISKSASSVSEEPSSPPRSIWDWKKLQRVCKKSICRETCKNYTSTNCLQWVPLFLEMILDYISLLLEELCWYNMKILQWVLLCYKFCESKYHIQLLHQEKSTSKMPFQIKYIEIESTAD